MRIAFRMSVHEGREKEYKKRHKPIWEELERTLLEHGVQTYSIFIDPETNDLFAYAEIESQERWEAIAETGICHKWWKYMSPLMPGNPDGSPVAGDLKEVFHIDALERG